MSHVIAVYWSDFDELNCEVFNNISDAVGFVVGLYKDCICESVEINFGIGD